MASTSAKNQNKNSFLLGPELLFSSGPLPFLGVVEKMVEKKG